MGTVKAMTAGERNLFLTTAQAVAPEWYTAWTLMALAGLRRNEALQGQGLRVVVPGDGPGSDGPAGESGAGPTGNKTGPTGNIRRERVFGSA